MQMFGRTVIYTDASSVIAKNARNVLNKALSIHMLNWILPIRRHS